MYIDVKIYIEALLNDIRHEKMAISLRKNILEIG